MKEDSEIPIPVNLYYINLRRQLGKIAPELVGH